MTRVIGITLLAALAVLGLGFHAAHPADPRAVDGQAIDPDAELAVALAHDTNNTDTRSGVASIRSNYIRQVFESLVDVDATGKPQPGLALAWRAINENLWEVQPSQRG